ncbi:hypothetical protein [Bradyrhizobium sp. CIR3A]|uniref:hypothetical protein n=1 Tax=Bradyrhizobium sp. CIR3A TaxID=2663838 RepID=UPI00160670C2|nr:hypothetical protein [Bradyrhizobium sp. CIR3A]MBB4258774.1 hypothetical protein [Bradyrhizobium sp. CIR3A]
MVQTRQSSSRSGIDATLVFAESAPGAGDSGSVLLQGETGTAGNETITLPATR